VNAYYNSSYGNLPSPSPTVLPPPMYPQYGSIAPAWEDPRTKSNVAGGAPSTNSVSSSTPLLPSYYGYPPQQVAPQPLPVPPPLTPPSERRLSLGGGPVMSAAAASLLSASLELLASHNLDLPVGTDKGSRVSSLPASLSGSVILENTEEGAVNLEDTSSSPLAFDDAVPFLMSLCAALHKFGAPAHRVEYNMHRASEALGLAASFAVLPTLIIISIGPEGERQQTTHLFRGTQGLNLAKLHLTDELAAKVAHGEIDLKVAIQSLTEILESPPLYPEWFKVLCFGICSASVAPVFFRGSWIEMGLSFFLGLMVGLLNQVSRMSADFERLCEAISAVLASFIARLFMEYMHPACFGALSLSAIIWLLPGLSITMAVAELITKNMVAGTARIFYAMLVALELGFGMAIGAMFVFWRDEASFIERDVCSPLNPFIQFILFFVVSTTFNILFGAHPTQWPVMTATALSSYSIAKFVAWRALRPEIGTVLAAFGVGIVGNIYARLSGQASIIPILSGIVLLVPGSIGVRGVKAFMEDDVISGISFGFSMLVIALSIIVGLFVANIIVPPKRSPKPSVHHSITAV
jgi:uncharacterized membrane protein YjjP (DUF1212 family)